ncbi:MAG: tyrosine-type recombinase/integrase [bacterium]
MNQNIVLQYKHDFLLELANNNYSLETVYNYSRDLSVFEGFLELNHLAFDDVDKRLITHYKGFLRSPIHYLDQLHSINWDINADAFNFINAYSIKKNINNDLDKTKIKTYHGEKIGARSINRMLSALRSYLRYLIDFDLKPVPIPPEAIKLIKIERKDSQVAEFGDLIRLIECPTTLEKDQRVAQRNRAMLELLFSTGMRISELLRLNRQDLNQDGKIYVMGKGKKQRFVYLTERAVYYVNEYISSRSDSQQALFVPYRGGRNGQHGQRLSANYLQEKIAEYRRILGIVVPTSAHSLRHGFATYLAEQGANAAAIQILLGHESLHTTSRYVHPSDKFAQRTHREYHPLYDMDNKNNEKKSEDGLIHEEFSEIDYTGPQNNKR